MELIFARNLLNKYDDIVLDFSVMFAELDNNFIKALNESMKILVSPTFICECEQIEKVVSYRIAMRYKNNKRRVVIDDSKICKYYGITDTFKLANCLSHGSNSVLVVEANYSLEDRIVLSNTNVDVYSLWEKRIIKHGDYPAKAAKRAIDRRKTPETYYEVKAGDVVYTKAEDSIYTEDKQYVLENLVESGAEAQIFKIRDNPDILAKVYKEDENGNFVLTTEKLNNIKCLREIADTGDIEWVAWPAAVIYVDLAHTKPVGYTMKYFDKVQFLSNNSLFSGGDINVKFSEYEGVTVKNVLDICIRFVRQILYLALNDIHISDYNDKNFAEPINSDNKIVMIDADSYCCEEYVSECITYSGCLSKKYECDTWLDLINLCDESLFAFIFTRLVLDSSFVPMRKSEFRFSANRMEKLNNPNIKAKWNSIPENLQNLFIDIFDKKYPPSISILLYQLVEAERQRFADTRYKDIYKEALDAIAGKSATQPKLSPQPSKPVQRPLPPQSFNKLKKSKVWMFVCIGMAVALIALAIWWWDAHSDVATDEKGSSETSSNIEENEISSPQLQRYDTDDGYYMSYGPELDGYIEYYWNNGDSYKGEFADGQMTGSGTYDYQDGSKYTGSFLNGERCGQGTLYNAGDKKIYEGGWKDGYFSGEGIYYFPNGAAYEETWENGTCHGGGTVSLRYTSNKESAAEGYWSENIFYGDYYEDGQWHTLP